MSVQRLPGLLTHNLYSIMLWRNKHLPGLLPRVLQSCIFHLSRINSSATPAASPKFHAVSLATARHFSNSSYTWAVKRTTASTSKKSRIGSVDDMCQVFDQNEMLIGQMTIREAEELAKKDNLKLVDMGENSDRLRSFRLVTGRELAEVSKRQRAEKKSEKVKEKEFRVASNITDHDLDIKLGQVRNVLLRGAQVKFVIKAHRRTAEAESDKMISQLFKKVTSQLQDCAAIKQGIRTQTEQQLLLVPQASAQSSESAETPLA